MLVMIWFGLIGFLTGKDDAVSPSSLSEQRVGVVSKTLQCDRELYPDSAGIPQILATYATDHCASSRFLSSIESG